MSHDQFVGIPQTPRWSEELAQALGHHVAEFREKLRMSAEDLSKATRDVGQQIPRSTIQKIETGGKKSVQLHEALILAQALGVPLGYLLFSPYTPTQPATTPYASEAVPYYWAADAISPVDYSLGDTRGNPNTQAVSAVRSHAKTLSKIATVKTAIKDAGKYINHLEALGFSSNTHQLKNMRDSLNDVLSSNLELDKVIINIMNHLGIKPWRLEEHFIPISFYEGETPESYDPWGINLIYETELEMANNMKVQ